MRSWVWFWCLFVKMTILWRVLEGKRKECLKYILKYILLEKNLRSPSVFLSEEVT